MKVEIAEQWATALESGEYEQGRGYLKVERQGDPPRFCCKGVLCDLAIKAGVSIEVSSDGSGGFANDRAGGRVIHFDGDWTLLPAAVINWAEIQRGDAPFVDLDNDPKYLWELNDEGYWDFPRIAAVIRAQGAHI